MDAKIETLRALAVAINSLRYNSSIDTQTADLYEMRLVNLRDAIIQRRIEREEPMDGESWTIEKAIARAREVAEGCPAKGSRCEYEHKKLADWLEELKAYRETGQTPEEIHKLLSIDRWNDEVEKEWLKCLKMEEDGRLVKLPCKVTDTVYIVETVFENGKQKKRNKPSGERVVSAQIDHVTIGGTTGEPVYDLCSETGKWYHAMELRDFHLTKEEAEVTLNGWEG